MTISAHLASSYPGTFFLQVDDLAGITQYLRSKGWIGPQESVGRAACAGEGNMNCALRIQTPAHSFILKQARPWVEKYPQIPAPWNRAEAEARFYKQVQSHPEIAAHMPKLLGFDPMERVLMLEDLRTAQDFTFLYRNGVGSTDEADLGVLTHYLAALHGRFRDRNLAEMFSNAEMRALNHEHIFAFPLRPDNDLDLDAITPGLGLLARQLQNDCSYCDEVKALGDCYLDELCGSCLVHGDYFPGSWLKAENRVCVIDPEFCFFGPPEWDLGTMIGHLYLIGASEELVDRVSTLYAAAAPFDISSMRQFAGVEIMRRLIGVAQLPLGYGLNEKQRLLELSRRLVVN